MEIKIRMCVTYVKELENGETMVEEYWDVEHIINQGSYLYLELSGGEASWVPTRNVMHIFPYTE